MGKNSSKQKNMELAEDDILFLIEITNYDRDTITKWYKTFLEECPKGTLSKKTFIKVYQGFYKTNDLTIKAEKFCTQVFDAFDLDQNGSIDFYEFMIGLSFAHSTDVRRRLKLAFKIYDLDKNGFITKKEMEQVIIAIYKMIGQKKTNNENSPKRRVEIMFQKMDLNNDGVLTEEEFVTGCLNDPVLIEAINIKF